MDLNKLNDYTLEDLLTDLQALTPEERTAPALYYTAPRLGIGPVNSLFKLEKGLTVASGNTKVPLPAGFPILRLMNSSAD